MEKRTMYKRCIAWILTLVMMLNVVNLPTFTLGVKAEEAATTYTVIFDSDGGTWGNSEATKTVTVGDSKTVSEPSPAPIKEGYKLSGWHKNGEDSLFNFVTPIKENITLKAKWEPESYTINYTGLEGAAFEKNVTNPATYTIEDNITLNNPKKAGYIFTGWTGSNGTTPQENVTIAKGSKGEKNYKANWTASTIKVTIAPGSYVYNGKKQEPKVTVTDTVKNIELVKDKDYTLTYANNIDAGTATVTITGKGSYEGRTGSGTFEIKKGVLTPKYTPVIAYCGQKLSEIVVYPTDEVKGQFKWNYTGEFTKDTVMSGGGEYTISATFEPENKNYENNKDVKIIVKVIHDFDKLTNLEHHEEEEVNEEKKKAGRREYYYCTVCGKYYDALEREQEKEYFIVPYVEESITVILGSGNTSIDEYVTDGKEGVDFQVMESPSKYKNYLTFDEKTGTINTPKSKKYYKKKIKNPTIVVTDKAGDTYSVNVKLQITKPTVDVDMDEYTSVSGIASCKYTITCTANSADQFVITVVSGLAKSSTKKSLNKALKKRSLSQFKKKKNKATVTVSFTIAKKSIKKKKKLSFQVYAKYGANKSAVFKGSK